MTIRDLTEEQVTLFQREAHRRMNEIDRFRTEANKINRNDYSLGFSDGMKTVLARVTELPQ